MPDIEKMSLESLNIREEQLRRLKEIFPEVFTEGNKIDYGKLKLTLGENIDAGKERFGLNWPGKADCFKTMQTPSIATLEPCRGESMDFDKTENLFIEGDNLEVLKLLQKSYSGKIKMIYIDPPYNTGNDFIYPDDYTESLQTYLEYTGQVDSEGRRYTANTEAGGRFHSKWLNMMHPRLFLAKNLLKEDGVIFISIDDNEVHNLRALCNEIFGEENFVAVFPWKKRTTKSDVPFGISQDYEWVISYTKGLLNAGLSMDRKYYQTDDYPNDKWRLADLTKQTSANDRPNSAFNLVDPKNGKIYSFNPNRVWAVTRETFLDYYNKGKIVFPDDYEFLNIKIPAFRVFESEDKIKALQKYGSEDIKKSISTFLPKEVGMNEDGNKEMIELFNAKIFSFPKPSTLIKHLVSILNDQEAMILDFFAGSGTTAHAVMELNKEDGGNRKYICVQLPELTDEKSEAYKAGYKTIADIGKERVRRVINKIKKEREDKAGMFDNNGLDLGFKVFKLMPSNFKIWNTDIEKDPEKIQEALELHVDNLTPEAKQESILYELLLKSGAKLSTPVESLSIEGKTVYSVDLNDGKRFICLEKKLTHELIKAIAEMKPQTVICLDEGFQNNDQLKTNASLMLKSKGVVTFQTV